MKHYGQNYSPNPQVTKWELCLKQRLHIPAAYSVGINLEKTIIVPITLIQAGNMKKDRRFRVTRQCQHKRPGVRLREAGLLSLVLSDLNVVF